MKIKDYTLGSESYLQLRSILYYSYWSDVALKELNMWIDSESTIMSFKTSSTIKSDLLLCVSFNANKYFEKYSIWKSKETEKKN